MLKINLSISLHAPDDITRNKTRPINKRYPIEQLVDACKKYVEITGRKIFFEYVLLKGQNDSIEHAKKLALSPFLFIVIIELKIAVF